MKLFFVLGKGGVGKTTLSAAIAKKYSEKYRTLVVSLDPAHNLGDVFDKRLDTKAKKITDNLFAAEIDIDKAVKDYIGNLQRALKHTYRYLTVINLEKYFDVLKNYPGVEESALLEAMKNLIEKREYEVIIFDTPPTGLTLRILSLAEMTLIWLKELIEIRKKILDRRRAIEKIQGELCVVIEGEKFDIPTSEEKDAVIKEMYSYRTEIENLISVMRDRNISKFIAVLNPEQLSYLETKRIVDYLKKIDLDLHGIIINKYEENEMSKKIVDEFSRYSIYTVPLLSGTRGLDSLANIASHLGDV
jgi:arsenite-transporting ATPase